MAVDNATKEALAQEWRKSLADIDHFLDITEPECPVWHSADDRYVPVEEAVRAVHDRSAGGAVPDFQYVGHTLTDPGFFLEANVVIEVGGNPLKMHLIQVVTVGDSGKAVNVKEYIGPEMDVQP